MKEHFGEVNINWAGFLAGSANGAGLREGRVIRAEKPRRDNRADGTGIDAIVSVTANLTKNGAGVETRAATDAKETVVEGRVA